MNKNSALFKVWLQVFLILISERPCSSRRSSLSISQMSKSIKVSGNVNVLSEQGSVSFPFRFLIYLFILPSSSQQMPLYIQTPDKMCSIKRLDILVKCLIMQKHYVQAVSLQDCDTKGEIGSKINKKKCLCCR